MPGDDEGPAASRRIKLISARDIALLFYLAALAPPAWLIPERSLLVVGRIIAWSAMRLHPRPTRDRVAAVRSLFGNRLKVPPTTLYASMVANVHVHNMLYLRALRPGGWKPSIRVVGAHHVQRALESGHGAVLWTAPLVYNSLVTKMGLSAAGLDVGHLSHINHNLSGTRFGAIVLNGLVRTVENRYLSERYVMRRGKRTEALRNLRRRVDNKGVVSVTFGGSGGRTRTVPFLDRTLDLATGAPELARRTGALLATVLTVREAEGSFVTRIEPIDVTAAEGRRADSVAAAADEFASAFATEIENHPDQCPPSV